MGTRAGRKYALFAGMAAAIVLGLSGVLWRDLAREYHGFRFRSQPDYFSAAIQAPEGSLARSALLSYLESRAGKEAFFRLYAGEAIDPAVAGSPYEPMDFEKGVIWRRSSRLCVWLFRPGRNYAALATKPIEPARLLALHALLPELEGGAFTAPTHPGLRFRVLRGDEPFRICGVAEAPGAWVEEADMALLVER